MIHPVDAAAALVLAHGPRRLRFFTEGWGDPEHLGDLDVAALAPPEPVDVAWSPPRLDAGLRIVDGIFDSPAGRLPGRARRGRVRVVSPPEGAERVMVLMAAWNDHGFATRTKLAVQIAEHGVATAMLENPFYGDRRPDPGDGQPIRTVADFAAMGRAAVIETRNLLVTFSSQYATVGVGGYSMGGSVGALVSATMPFPVATAALAAAYSPAPVYTEGVLSNGVDWVALGGRDTAEPRLRDLLERASTLRLPAPPHTAAAVVVGATRDGYVPRAATEALHRHWPGSALWWVPAGHGTLLWRHKARLGEAVAAAFERLTASG